jgi:hypothetical protein
MSIKLLLSDYFHVTWEISQPWEFHVFHIVSLNLPYYSDQNNPLSWESFYFNFFLNLPSMSIFNKFS